MGKKKNLIKVIERELKDYDIKKPLKTKEDVKRLFQWLLVIRDTNFHPDNPFADYVDMRNGEPTFTDREVKILDKRMSEAFEILPPDEDISKPNNNDVYAMAIEVDNEVNGQMRKGGVIYGKKHKPQTLKEYQPAKQHSLIEEIKSETPVFATGGRIVTVKQYFDALDMDKLPDNVRNIVERIKGHPSYETFNPENETFNQIRQLIGDTHLKPAEEAIKTEITAVETGGEAAIIKEEIATLESSLKYLKGKEKKEVQQELSSLKTALKYLPEETPTKYESADSEYEKHVRKLSEELDNAAIDLNGETEEMLAPLRGDIDENPNLDFKVINMGMTDFENYVDNNFSNDNSINAEWFKNIKPVYDAFNKFRAAINPNQKFIVFNQTDGFFASPDEFSLKQAESYVKAFPENYRRQGYYRTGHGEQISPDDVVLIIKPAEESAGEDDDETFKKGGEITPWMLELSIRTKDKKPLFPLFAVKSFNQAKQKTLDYIKKNNISSESFIGGRIYDGERIIANLHYDGTVTEVNKIDLHTTPAEIIDADITRGVEFKDKAGNHFIIDEVTLHNIKGQRIMMVSSSLKGGAKGTYRDTISEMVSFLNSEDAQKVKFATGGQLCPASTEIQTLLFDKHKFSKESAKHWAKGHGMHSEEVDEKENTYRLRQAEPDKYRKDSFRTIHITSGIEAVIACPKKADEKPVHHTVKVKYKDKEYPARVFVMKLKPSDKDPVEVMVACECLRKALSKSKFIGKAAEIDNGIIHYVSEDLINTASDDELAKLVSADGVLITNFKKKPARYRKPEKPTNRKPPIMEAQKFDIRINKALATALLLKGKSLMDKGFGIMCAEINPDKWEEVTTSNMAFSQLPSKYKTFEIWIDGDISKEQLLKELDEFIIKNKIK